MLVLKVFRLFDSLGFVELKYSEFFVSQLV